MALIDSLARGWPHNRCSQAQDFAQRWAEKFRTVIEIKQAGDNSLRFVSNHGEVRLRGMTEVNCLLLGGGGGTVAETLRDFKQRFLDSSGAPFVLAASDEAFALAEEIIPRGRRLLLSAAQLETALKAAEPETHLKLWLREQVSLRRLIPYNHLLSVEGGMFFGRRNELDKLRDEGDVSFAVAGPGRIGKTSLVKQHKRELTEDRGPQSSRSFYVDFYHCAKDPRSVVRFLAMHIDSSKRSSEVTVERMRDYLSYLRYKLGGSLNLLLDEVDEVCQGEAFNAVCEAAKEENCRLVICGKGELLGMMLNSTSPLKHRLRLIRLNPLDEASARDLLLGPLADLGFTIDDAERLVEQIYRLTGWMPHLMQFFARKLVDLAIEEKTITISPAQVEALKWDYETAQFFISPLNDLKNERARLVAFLLLKERRQEITPAFVRRLAARWGVFLNEMEALSVCNELVINNVLAWNKGSFQIANEALAEFARRLGILDSSLEKARRSLA